MKKKILITGLSSYIGNSFAETYKGVFDITKISLKNDDWKNLDFSDFDSVLHVAGIAHTSKDISQKAKYYAVNTDLTEEIAKKSKDDGVKQFIFLSSIIVYGDSAPMGKSKVITEETIPSPDDFYGDSKLQAEKRLTKLNSESFKVAIIRPPMVYGEGSKGNYPKLIKLANYAFIFPDIDNKRSVIYITNLAENISKIVTNDQQGLFLPQDSEYFCTSQFIKSYRKEVLGKKTYLTKIFNPFIKLLAKKIGFVNKVFGSLVYGK